MVTLHINTMVGGLLLGLHGCGCDWVSLHPLGGVGLLNQLLVHLGSQEAAEGVLLHQGEDATLG